MCLIAYAPKGQLIPREVLSYAAHQNDDGIGVMSSDGIRKYLGKKMLKRARRYIEELSAAEIPYAVHMRWATHGAVCLNNTHPYQSPAKTHWIMHNGVISLTTAESTEEESDTAVYVRKFLHDAPDFEDTQYYEAVGRHIGYGNKLVIMDEDSRFKICNEGAGDWIAGIWYSNTYSLPVNFVPRKSYYANTSSYLGEGWEFGGAADKVARRYDWHTRGWYCPETHTPVEKTWNDGTKTWMIVPLAKAVVAVGNKDFPRKELPLLPRSALGHNRGIWNHEDQRAYYEALEAGLTPTESDAYLDPGVNLDTASGDMEPGELAALREQQGRVLAASLSNHDKEEAPVGGDFAEGGAGDDGEAPEGEDDIPNWRKYMKAVAATVHV